MALHRCSRYRKSRCQTVRERGECCFQERADYPLRGTQLQQELATGGMGFDRHLRGNNPQDRMSLWVMSCKAHGEHIEPALPLLADRLADIPDRQLRAN